MRSIPVQGTDRLVRRQIAEIWRLDESYLEPLPADGQKKGRTPWGAGQNQILANSEGQCQNLREHQVCHALTYSLKKSLLKCGINSLSVYS
ncbi:protein of unknown function [Burkholderia multivorans]